MKRCKSRDIYQKKVTTEDGLNKKRKWNPWIPGHTWTMLLHVRLRLWLKADKQWSTLHMDASYAVTSAHNRKTYPLCVPLPLPKVWLYIWARHVKSNPSNPSCRTETKHAFGGSCGSSKPASHLGFNNNHSWGSTRSLKALPTRHHLTSEYCQTFISLIYQQVRQHQAHTVRAMTMMETIVVHMVLMMMMIIIIIVVVAVVTNTY